MKELIEIQKALKVPKGQWNDFSNFHYRSCEDVLKAVKPLLHARDCYLIMRDEMFAIEGRVYIKAVISFVGPSETIEVSAYAREAESRKGMNADQLTGATSSYARKYALNGLFCIDDSKDSDATNKHGKGTQKAEELPAANMEYLASKEGITFLKSKGKTALLALKWLALSRTVTLDNEAKIQELWEE